MTALELTEKLKEIVLAKYKTQYRAAAEGKINRATLNCMFTRPTYTSAFKIADIFGIELDIVIKENK
ncbi:TPA: hypothetical protein NQG77_000227 [Salmonella enterica subsp. enterica serovar Infantis]|nr:hypothetical protein [Salmonella enterica subsp. enterica serovar Infantis]